MITLDELKSKARLKGLSMENAEKDYLIDLLLLSISRNTKDELVFKGGTCLYKFYGLDRFSEDADFTATKYVDMDKIAESIISDMKQFGVTSWVHKKKEPFNSVLLTLRCEGPLFRSTPQSVSSVRMDVNLRSSVDAEPLVKTYNSFYSEIPAFSILAMQEKEILAEKIRAVMTRNKARDLYDLWALVNRGTGTGEFVGKKLEYYNMKFNYRKFAESVDKKSSVWERELKPLLKNIPPFDEVKKLVLTEAKKWKSRKKRR